MKKKILKVHAREKINFKRPSPGIHFRFFLRPPPPQIINGQPLKCDFPLGGPSKSYIMLVHSRIMGNLVFKSGYWIFGLKMGDIDFL